MLIVRAKALRKIRFWHNTGRSRLARNGLTRWHNDTTTSLDRSARPANSPLLSAKLQRRLVADRHDVSRCPPLDRRRLRAGLDARAAKLLATVATTSSAPMTTDQQRIAIATACGWTTKHKGLWVESLKIYAALPNYLNDLNAMHEAEQVLTYEQKEQFVFWLNHIHPSADIHHSDGQKDFRLEVFSLVHSPASQRAEAFLRTLNLWQPTPTQPQ